MRSPPGTYCLSFVLPDGIAIDSGAFAPSADGCSVHIFHRLVKILGPSREAVFEHASVMLRVIHRAAPCAAIAATLESPAPIAGRDGWSIIVGAPIAFSPTSLDPYFPRKFQ
jgi:hypothetical protein